MTVAESTSTVVMTHAPDAQRTTAFEREVGAGLSWLRDAVARVVEAVPGRNARSTDLSRTLHIDKKLGWKIMRITQCRDPFAIIEHIPGASGFEIFINAVQKNDVPEKTVADARQSFANFQHLIDTHAGDRASLEMMVRAFVADSREEIHLAHRREAFLGNSFIHGVQAKTQVSVNIIGPSKDQDRVDIALISALVDLRRLRPNVAWIIARLGNIGSGTTQRPATSSERIAEPPDAQRQAPRVPLIEPFCSQPLPDVRTLIRQNGDVEVELADGPVGDTGATTCVLQTGLFRAAAPRVQKPNDPPAQLHAHVRTPCSMLVHDLLVHHDLFGRLHPTGSAWSEVHRELRFGTIRDDRYKLPIDPEVAYIGRGAASARTPDVARYPELLEYVLHGLDWDEQEFDIYRLCLRFPPMPSAVTMSFNASRTG